jgi:hypothetical protein
MTNKVKVIIKRKTAGKIKGHIAVVNDNLKIDWSGNPSSAVITIVVKPLREESGAVNSDDATFDDSANFGFSHFWAESQTAQAITAPIGPGRKRVTMTVLKSQMPVNFGFKIDLSGAPEGAVSGGGCLEAGD